MNAINPGWKTTEFWLTLSTLVLQALVLLGVIGNGDVDPYMKAMAQIISGVFGVVAIGTYNHSRALVKTAIINSYDVQETVDAVDSVETPAETPVSDNSGV